MATARLTARWLTVCLLLGSITTAPARAQKREATQEDILNYRPRQEAVNISTPAADEVKSCTIQVFKGTRPNSSGYILKDPQGRILRRLFDQDGDTKVDVWSYYKDGVEVYRETSINLTNASGPLPQFPNDFRWLNGGGSKWGVDLHGDGKISYWRTISPEEAAQEVFQAVVARDFGRLQALFVSEAELRALKMPQPEITRIMEQVKQAAAKFQKTMEKLGDTMAKATFVRVESAPPQTTPSENGGPDLIKYAGRSILYEIAGKHDWLQTGEMIQVGRATWRLVDAPVPGDIPPPAPDLNKTTNPELQKLQEQLSVLDQKTPQPDAPKAEIIRYNQDRVSLVQQILAKVTEPSERETWTKQLGDNLSTLAQANEAGARDKLVSMRDDLVRSMPGSNLAGYLTYRVLWTDYAAKLVETGPEAARIQEQWMGELSKFVQAYPKAEDTPDALQQLAVGCEFAGKDDEAKRWYQLLVTNFPNDPLTPKAAGAVRRLELVGKPMELAGNTVGGGPFDLHSLSGKVVVVYYWTSTCKVCTGDFARIKQMLTTQGPKGMELVTVNLDDRPEEAGKYLQATPLPGTHLVQPATTGPAAVGLNGPLAIQYGINGLPSMFLVGKDGKVISTKMQINDLEEAVRKAL